MAAASNDTTSDVNPTPLDATGWSLTGFDGFSGWYLDRSLWPVVYDGPAANSAYAWSPADVILYGAGELLVRSINTESGWTSGGIGEGWNAQTYGRYEIRARADAGQGTAAVIGLWPADNSYPPEIDMLEAPTADRQVAYFTYHGETGGGETTGFQIDVTQWHVYALDWLPGRLVYYIDGVKVLERTADVPDEPMTLNITGFVGEPGDAFTRGGPDASTPWYVDLHVDWVRIWTPDSLMPGNLPATQYDGLATAPDLVRTGVREVAGERFAASWNAGEWGAIHDAAAAPARWGGGLATALLYANYTELDLDLRMAGRHGIDLLAVGAQRGTLVTGRGDDHVTWVAHGDTAGVAANAMRILTGAGDDAVLVTAAGASDLDQPFGYGSHWNPDYNGRLSLAVVATGPGNDSIEAEAQVRLRASGGAGADSITGGAKPDAIIGGPGDDLLAGGGGRDLFVLRQGDGVDRISDFATGADRLRLPSALSGSVHWEVGSDGSDSGTWVHYGSHGDQVFLRSVSNFSSADIVFA